MKKTQINIKKLRPTFSGIITTADVFTEADCTNNSGLIDSNRVGTIKNIQTIVSTGPEATARGFKEGDLVSLNFNRYAEYKQKKDSIKSSMKDEIYNGVITYHIPTVTINYEDYLHLDVGDVEFITEDYEISEIEVNTSGLIKPELVN